MLYKCRRKLLYYQATGRKSLPVKRRDVCCDEKLLASDNRVI